MSNRGLQRIFAPEHAQDDAAQRLTLLYREFPGLALIEMSAVIDLSGGKRDLIAEWLGVSQDWLQQLANIAKVKDREAFCTRVGKFLFFWCQFVSDGVDRKTLIMSGAEARVVSKFLRELRGIHSCLVQLNSSRSAQMQRRSCREAGNLPCERPSKDEKVNAITYMYLHERLCQMFGPDTGIPWLLQIISKTQEAALQTRDAVAPPYFGGRPRGISSYPWILDLIEGIQFIALLTGGKFVVDRFDPKGSLMEALKLLRDHLPTQQIPPPDERRYVKVYYPALAACRKAVKKDLEVVTFAVTLTFPDSG